MSKQTDFNFKITSKISVQLAPHKGHPGTVISCETKDGKSIHLEADYQTLEKNPRGNPKIDRAGLTGRGSMIDDHNKRRV